MARRDGEARASRRCGRKRRAAPHRTAEIRVEISFSRPVFGDVSRPADPINPNESSRIFPQISRDYSNYMIPQIAGSLTEFTWNFRVLKFAIHQGNYADYVRIADYIDLLKFRQFYSIFSGNR